MIFKRLCELDEKPKPTLDSLYRSVESMARVLEDFYKKVYELEKKIKEGSDG